MSDANIEKELEVEDALDAMTILAREHGYLTCKIEQRLDLDENRRKRDFAERKAREIRVGLRTKIRALIPRLP